MTRRAGLLAALALLAAGPAPALAAPPEIGLVVQGRTGDAGWYVSEVVLRWTVTGDVTSTSGCEPAQRLAADTARGVHTCRAENADGAAERTAIVKIDRTAPTGLAAATARAPDSGGELAGGLASGGLTPAAAPTAWFTKPVDVTWRGTDATSGIASCTALTYAGPDTPAAPLTGTCRDQAGNTSAALATTLAYDATPPTAAPPTPDRPPTRSGWFTKPVTLAWSGADAPGGSGVTSCTTLTFAGPDGPGAHPAGTCTDAAGNTSAPTPATVNYDATAPTLTNLAAQSLRRGRARLSWQVEGATRVTITRRPGRRGRASTRIYRGLAKHAAIDRGLRTGRRYTYSATAADQAGNLTTKRIRLVGGAATTALLVAPRHGAQLTKPPTLRWRAVANADYYNVQLFRGRTKLRTSWPSATRLQTPRNLRPGLYRWYVWPGYGRRADERYGRLALKAAFRIRRAAGAG